MGAERTAYNHMFPKPEPPEPLEPNSSRIWWATGPRYRSSRALNRSEPEILQKPHCHLHISHFPEECQNTSRVARLLEEEHRHHMHALALGVLRAVCWVLVEGFTLSYKNKENKETILFTVDPQYGNFNFPPYIPKNPA